MIIRVKEEAVEMERVFGVDREKEGKVHTEIR